MREGFLQRIHQFLKRAHVLVPVGADNVPLQASFQQRQQKTIVDIGKADHRFGILVDTADRGQGGVEFLIPLVNHLGIVVLRLRAVVFIGGAALLERHNVHLAEYLYVLDKAVLAALFVAAGHDLGPVGHILGGAGRIVHHQHDLHAIGLDFRHHLVQIVEHGHVGGVIVQPVNVASHLRGKAHLLFVRAFRVRGIGAVVSADAPLKILPILKQRARRCRNSRKQGGNQQQDRQTNDTRFFHAKPSLFGYWSRISSCTR